MQKLSLKIITFVILIKSMALTSNGQLTLSLTPSNYNGYNISCFGGRDGTIDLMVTGGSGNFTFHWSNGAQTEDISNLQSGYFRVTVVDNGAPYESAEAEITLNQPDQLILPDAVSSSYPNGYNISLFGACNGSIQINPQGGVSPYSYFWGDGSTSHNRWSLCQGQYNVSVTDANGCTINSEHFTIIEPPPSDWRMSGNAGSDTTPRSAESLSVGLCVKGDSVAHSTSVSILLKFFIMH